MKRLKLVERECTQCGGLGHKSHNDEYGYTEPTCLCCGGSGTTYDNNNMANNGFLILDVVPY